MLLAVHFFYCQSCNSASSTASHFLVHGMICQNPDFNISSLILNFSALIPSESTKPGFFLLNFDFLSTGFIDPKMGRQPCCDKFGLKRGPWTVEEDHKLMCFILNNGIQCWRMVPKLAGLLRCGKSCRLRWINYLRPDLKRGAFSEMEEDDIIELHARLGNRWSKIASHFPGRTDNEIKNHWNTRIKKRLKLQGLDHVTHKPLEPKLHVEEENESNIGSNLQYKQELAIDTISEHGNAKITEDSSQTNDECETSYLINNFDHLMCKNLDMDSWMMSQHVTNLNSSCYSLSLEESVSYANTTGKSAISVHDENTMKQNWVESVDSMMCWDGFNQLDQQFFLGFHHEGSDS